jgi:circadian clock protein KaiC
MTTAHDLLATDVPGLDAVLNGGLRRNALALIIGAPGAGKTVLGSQILFRAARQGIPTLVCTSFSESNEQYTSHMRSFSFFDQSLIGAGVTLYSLQSQLMGAAQPPASVIMRSIRETRAKLVLIDGFQGFSSELHDQHSLRALLATLSTQIRYLDTTLLLTLAGEAHDTLLHQELTIADTVIGMSFKLAGRRHQRLIEVVKQRGHPQLSGAHSYRLTGDGVQVFPRIEAYQDEQSQATFQPHERATFDLPELDALLDGGLNKRTTTLLAGSPGSGKTTLALRWALSDAQPAAPTLFITFGEHWEQLQAKAKAFNLDLAPALANGALRYARIAPVEIDPDAVAQQIIDVLDTTPIARLVLDDIAALLKELGDRARDFVAALNGLLYARGATSMLLLEVRPADGLQLDIDQMPIAPLCDNVLMVQQYEVGGELRRLLAVIRMRFSNYDRTLRELVFEQNGIRVLRAHESQSGVLAAAAQKGGGVAPPDEQPLRGDARGQE